MAFSGVFFTVGKVPRKSIRGKGLGLGEKGK